MPMAMAFAEYGGPEVLAPLELAEPHPGPGQVRVAVRASGVNPLDAKLRSGTMAGAWPLELPFVPGSELAGTVDAVGEDVHDLSVGEAVMGLAQHCYATRAVADRDRLARVPEGMDVEHAAALPVAAETAWRALEELRVGTADTLLVHGAGGVVGAMAVRFALARGARVVGTASAAAVPRVAESGAMAVTYGDGVADRVRETVPTGVDAVLDTSGADVLGESVALAGAPDRVLSLVDPIAARRHGARFSSGSGGPVDHAAAGLAQVVALHREGLLRVPLHAVFPLAEAAEAHRALAVGHLDGKIVLSVS
ncbi:NADP-dependent oxidoreductase [Streptomyces spiramenti]|uniref:NADP-dependent oxidoreductase n=1 Tax=Streptomyces spiramenti TaxID=2720606 RepID=A0ABX1AK75_9ACTN|nr:NADP-dependent oxidoreductase [Streptomyces spiramenti]NJP66406.1 NADP-dependent oxidoreductase [Streptomyces spiramenti]